MLHQYFTAQVTRQFHTRAGLHPEPDTAESKSAKPRRNRALEGLPDVASRFLPTVGLDEDALADGFGRKPAVGLLRDLKNGLLFAAFPSASP
jgi:hypothetical protein